MAKAPDLLARPRTVAATNRAEAGRDQADALARRAAPPAASSGSDPRVPIGS